jgi:hypothetical protein
MPEANDELTGLSPADMRQVCGECLAALAYLASEAGWSDRAAIEGALVDATRLEDTPDSQRRKHWWNSKLANIRWAFAEVGLNGATIHGVQLPRRESVGRRGQPGTQRRIQRFAINFLLHQPDRCRELARRYFSPGATLVDAIEHALFGRPLHADALDSSPLDIARGEPASLAIEPYVPGEDTRKRVTRQICQRRGQAAFRNALRSRYGDRCMVTGSSVLALLEAAHIRPYRGENDNHIENGLLLRADIHTLFDLDLIGVDPETMLVHVSRLVEAEYGFARGVAICKDTSLVPSMAALNERWSRFVGH